MASKGYAVLDMQNDDDELQFQDFGLGSSSSNTQTHVFTDYPDSPGHQADTDKLLGEYQDDEENKQKSEKDHSFWSFEFYQQFFDVDSKKVGDRILWSMVPKPGVNYLQMHLRPKPDLYGPFWICLTLVFAAAITGNISNYLQTQGDQTIAWRYDFHKVSLAAFMVFSYGWLVPLILWGVLRYKTKEPPLKLLEFTCLYGYSLSVLVPVCIVWTVPMVWLRWCVGIVGVVLSGAVLAKSVWEGLKGREHELLEEDETQSADRGSIKKVAMIILIIVIVMHVGIAMGFMFYFFREPLHTNKMMGPALTGPSSLASNISHPALQLSTNKDIITPTKRDVKMKGPESNDIEPKLPKFEGNSLKIKDKSEKRFAPLSNKNDNNGTSTENKPVETISNINKTNVISKITTDNKVVESVGKSTVKSDGLPDNGTSYKIKVLPKTARS